MQQDTDTADPTSSRSLNRSGGLTFSIDRREHEARLAVLLDLGGVSFFGAAGVTTLINLNRDAANAGIRLVLTGVGPTVRLVLDLTGTTDLIPIAYTRTVGRTA